MRPRTRALLGALRRLTPFLVVLGVYGVVAWVCTHLPLFDVLGYESSFLFAIVASFCACHLTVVLVHRWRRLRDDPLESPLTPLGGVLALYGRALLLNLGLLILPLDILSANAIHVRNCNYFAGVAWFLVLPGLSVVVAVAWGTALGLLPVRRRLGVLAGYLVILGSLALGFWRFYSEPPVCQYDPFAGYFSGNLYDDNIGITGTFGMARLYHLAGAAAVLLVAARFFVPGRARLTLRPGERRWRATLAALALLGVTGALQLLGGRIGYAVNRSDLIRELGTEHRTPHLILHVSPGSLADRQMRWQAADAEFRWHQLRQFFGAAPAHRIRIYFFKDAAQKRHWYGAARVDMAKPWSLETFLTQHAYPHPVLRHELAHVFAAVFGDRAFGVSVRWGWLAGFLPVPRFNPGLIEGAAVAADWKARGGLTPHQWAQAMILLHKAPRLEAVMGYGFFGAASSRSYTVAGSFCRFLVERYGPKPFQRVYRSGGDFRAAYGRSLATLEAQWRAFLQSVPLRPKDLDLARERFRQRPVFARPCVHEVARLSAQADKETERGEYVAAAHTYHRLCRYDPGDPDHAYGRMLAWFAAGQPGPAIDAAREVWGHPATTPTLRAALLRVLGNHFWRKGNRALAARLFARAQKRSMPAGMARDVAVRLWAVKDDKLSPRLRPLFAPRNDETVPSGAWARLAADFPRLGLIQYLVGSWRRAQGRWLGAARLLERALELGLPDARFRREAVLRLGAVYVRALRFGQARRVFARLDVKTESEAVRLTARDWMARCDFFARHGVELGLVPPAAAAPSETRP